MSNLEEKSEELQEFKHENFLPSYLNPATGIKFKIFLRHGQSRCNPAQGLEAGTSALGMCFTDPFCPGWGWFMFHHYYLKSSHRAFDATCFGLSIVFVYIAVISVLRALITRLIPAVSITAVKLLLPDHTETELSHHRNV